MTGKRFKGFCMWMLICSLMISSFSMSALAAKTSFGPGADYLGGAEILLLENQSAGQMLSVVITTKQGNLIVVDGGRDVDAEYLLKTLQEKGGHVSAWLVTHAHADHVGALNYILNRPEHGLTIDNIYYSFPEISVYQEREARNMDMVYAITSAFAAFDQTKLHPNITKGDQITVDDVIITVMNQAYICDSDFGNNTSVVYQMNINGKKALFLGDLGEDGGDRLLADYSANELKSDIVQMAHHGQNGVKESVYQAIRPEICLWPTPSWLWNNDNGGGTNSGPWRTIETRGWMDKLGVTRHYSIKDGDQRIR